MNNKQKLNRNFLKDNKILFLIFIIAILANVTVHFYRLVTYDRLFSPDARLYLDIGYSLRNFSSEILAKHSDHGGHDIGEIIMPGYPLLISPFFENIHVISIFQVSLFVFSLYFLYKMVTKKYLVIFVLLNAFWIILSTSWSYHVSVLIESPTISLLMIIIYYIDRYFNKYEWIDFLFFSILFGILISINNRYIFHYCGFIPFLFFLKIFEKRIKIKHLINSVFIVSLILTPWHVRQYAVYNEIMLFTPTRSKALERTNRKDSVQQISIKIQNYKNYLLDSLNHPLKDNPKELEEARLLSLQRERENLQRYYALKEAGRLKPKQPKKLVFEPEKKKTIDTVEQITLKHNNDPTILEKRLDIIGFDKKENSNASNLNKTRSATIYTKISDKSNITILETKNKGQVRKKEKSINQKINDLITQVNKINNTKFDNKNISVFVSQIDSLRFNNQTQYTKIIFDLINQADIAGLPDIKYTLLGIPKPIDSTLFAKNSQTPNSKPKAQNQKPKTKLNSPSPNPSTLSPKDSLSFLVSNLRIGLNEFNKQASQSNDNSNNNQIAKNETKTNNKLEEKTKGKQENINDKNKTQNKENKTKDDLAKNEAKTSSQKLDEKKEQKPSNKQENQFVNKKSKEVSKPTTKSEQQQNENIKQLDFSKNEAKYSSVINANKIDASNLASKVPTYQDSLYSYFKSNSLSKGTYKPESNLRVPNTTSDVVKNNSKSISKQENQTINTKAIDEAKPTSKSQQQGLDVKSKSDIGTNEIKSGSAIPLNQNEISNLASKVPTYQDSLYLYFKSNSLSKGTYKPESNLKGPNTTSDVVKNNSKSIAKQENKTTNTKAIDVSKPTSKSQQQGLDVKSKSDIGTNETKSGSAIPLNENEISNLASKVPTYQDSLYIYFKSNSLSKGTYKPESNLKGPNTTSDVVKNNSKSISKQENQKLSSKSIQATKATTKLQSQQKDIITKTEIAKNESKESNANFTKIKETKNKSAKTIDDQNYQVSNSKLKDANNTKIQNVVNIKQDIKKSPIIENKIKPEDLKPILVINKVISNETQNKNASKFRNDSIIIFPVLVNNESSKNNKNIKQIRYDTLDLATVRRINSDIEKLNIRKQVVIEDGRNRITIEDNKVVMIKVGDFENQTEFQKFENIRIRKMVPPYNEIIDALLRFYPKFGATPENLNTFLSDFSYTKYKQLVHDKFEPSNKYELIWNRFKEQFIFFRTEFGLTPQWDPRIYFPSHYNHWIQFILDLIMMPLIIINIIPFIIAIHKKDWLIISLGVLVFLHLLLHALVSYMPRYRITIYPVWITFAVYGYDQTTRYLIHVYKNRDMYKVKINKLLQPRRA